ncbi:uncharacterized protein LOC135120846 [Zophobas morio]|uniref:uncharacterized protein LOC135120846 n=1 Tax=Zophobas morio TaxID=2755281 RepID=UPI00308306A1
MVLREDYKRPLPHLRLLLVESPSIRSCLIDRANKGEALLLPSHRAPTRTACILINRVLCFSTLIFPCSMPRCIKSSNAKKPAQRPPQNLAGNLGGAKVLTSQKKQGCSCCLNEDDDPEGISDLERERLHFIEVVDAFKYYQTYTLKRVQRARDDLRCYQNRRNSNIIKKKNKKNCQNISMVKYINENDDNLSLDMFVGALITEKLDHLEDAIKKNQEFIDEIIAPHRVFEDSETFVVPEKNERCACSTPSELNMSKVVYTLKQFVRDWSLEVFFSGFFID